MVTRKVSAKRPDLGRRTSVAAKGGGSRIRDDLAKGRGDEADDASDEPKSHRTIDCVTQLLEHVVYRPGITFTELVRAVGAPKSSVYGFVQGLLSKEWLYEQDRGFYLGPAVYSLTLASGHIRAGMITHAELMELHQASGAAVFLGVEAGNHLIYIAEAGTDDIGNFEARANIRRDLLATAGGKALLAARPDAQLTAYLRRQQGSDSGLVDAFLDEYEEIRRTGIATNIRMSGSRFAIATAIRNQAGNPIGSITLVGRAADLQPRAKKLGQLLLQRVRSWSKHSVNAREAI